MSVTGLSVFDSTVQKTNTWLKDLMLVLDWDDKQKAYSALRAVLHALRDRLTIQEAAQLAAQLPMLIRGIYFEGWDPAGKPVKERHKQQFLARVADEFRGDPGFDPEEAARAVFAVISDRVTQGEIQDIEHMLPLELRDLWPSGQHA